jgi:hypothetical protein
MTTVPFRVNSLGERERPSIMVLRPPLIKVIILITAIADLAHNRGGTSQSKVHNVAG